MQSDKKLLKYKKNNLLHTCRIYATCVLHVGNLLKIKIKKTFRKLKVLNFLIREFYQFFFFGIVDFVF